MMNRLVALVALALAVLLTTTPATARAAPLEVVASFSILGDLVREVGTDRVRVTTLVGPDEDAHGFQPRPSDARLAREADLIVANGLGFDPWMERLARSSGHPRAVVVASEGVTPLKDTGDHRHSHGHGHNHGAFDPHAWQDVANVRHYVANIAAALAAADPDGATHYRENANRYGRELDALDADIQTRLAAVPDASRKIVTAHDAFGYFGHTYGVRFLAAAGVSNHSEASAAGVARLVRQLRREAVPVVFIENVGDPRLIDRIAREGGARLGGKLYSDALSGPDGPAPTYLKMMRHNLEVLVEGMTGADR